jgi:hypothetical protein
VLTSKELRALSKQHRAAAQTCTDRKLQEEYKKLAQACEALANGKDEIEGGRRVARSEDQRS